MSLIAYADDEMRLDLEVNPGLLPETQAVRMLEHLGRLLSSMATADPDTPICALDMLSDHERAELLALGRPETGPAASFDLLERFRSVVAQAPDRVAVQHAGEPGSLSYAKLDRRSDALAAALRERGAAAGEIVAIRLGRSARHVVALLAVLRSGAAVLPVDPSYPAAVVDHMLRDSAARLVIAEDMTDPEGGAQVISLETEATGADAGETMRDPTDPGYVIYTSGSTGTPKGVVVPTGAVAAHAAAIIRAFSLRPGDRVLQFAGLSFDVSIEEIVPTLLAGATLVLRSKRAAGSAPEFFGEIADLNLTVMNLPTVFFILSRSISRPAAHLCPTVCV